MKLLVNTSEGMNTTKKIRTLTKFLMNLKSLKVECDTKKAMKGNCLLG
jgi:hypothetical protein